VRAAASVGAAGACVPPASAGPVRLASQTGNVVKPCRYSVTTTGAPSTSSCINTRAWSVTRSRRNARSSSARSGSATPTRRWTITNFPEGSRA